MLLLLLLVHTMKIVQLPSNGFSRTGYTFKGWSTTKGGSVKYENNGYVRNLTPVKDATVTLYAVWEANTYTGTI